MGLWIGRILGVVDDRGTLAYGLWHGHEMLFGYVTAVLSGFLLVSTAGWRVVLLLLLWIAGRIAVACTAALPAPAVMAIDVAYLPALLLLRAPPVWQSPKWPTIGFVPLLLALTLANAALHAGVAGLGGRWAVTALRLVVDLMTLMVVVIAGRLVPGYTQAVLGHWRRQPPLYLERLSVVLMLALLAADAADWPVLAGGAAVAAGLLQARRRGEWRPWTTRGQPLLWVLHLGYGWVAVGLFLRGIAALTDTIDLTAALHAIMAGGFGLLTLGMMSRLGQRHTGRPLRVGRPIVAAYLLVFASALLRVAAPALGPDLATDAIAAAGAAWSLAFLLYLAVYAPILTAPNLARQS